MAGVLFTGGGSAGHVIPNLALLNKLREQGQQVFYVGSKAGIEKEIIAKAGNVPYYAIATGKLRRYFSWQNFIDPLKIFYGIMQAFFICRKLKPRVVFSKGGFVAFPVVVAAWLNHIPVIIHESDITPGLANRLSFPFAKKVCVTFAETERYINKKYPVVVTGTPIRPELLQGKVEHGLSLCGFSAAKKVLLIYGGGLGAQKINELIRALLPELLDTFQIIHVCGKGKVAMDLEQPGYKQFEFLHAELADMMACANIVISRAGANSIYELLTLNKPHILIPLPKIASRGDQLLNAKYCEKQGLSQVIYEEELTSESLYARIMWLSQHRAEVVMRLTNVKKEHSLQLLYDIILKYV
ncbi:MAG: undecaprenyldiphospho-muramoylpentapeptide beta-N-acetylglucosaminyltransferase [Gammaproteobacteria bacterium]|nr:undecaprenyldiphospho-muramoylpentapeptide beta-N-acetylglucosaminyltransferase [Gammaproteobacteria bacterium]